MKKHIVGFGLFSLIIVASAIAFVYFQPFDIYNAPNDNRRIAEFPLEELPAVNIGTKVTQAVIDAETRQIDLEIALDKKDGFNDGTFPLALYFYLNDGAGKTKIIGSEKITLRASDYNNAKATVKIKDSLSWLAKLHTFENLYVMVQPVEGNAEIQEFNPQFNANLAKPILLYSEKR